MKRHEIQLHHIAHDRTSWQARPQARDIRNNPGLHAYMYDEPHRELHRNTGIVPPPDYDSLIYVSNRLYEGRDPIKGIDEYCKYLEEAVNRPNIKPLVKKLGLLSIESMREQIPYILDGLAKERYHGLL